MTGEERRDVVLGLLKGRYYLLDTEEKIRHCALPLMLGGYKIPKQELEEIGMVLGDMTSVGPRSVNGLPIFTSIMLVHKDDWKLIVETYNREIKRLKRLKVGL